MAPLTQALAVQPAAAGAVRPRGRRTAVAPMCAVKEVRDNARAGGRNAAPSAPGHQSPVRGGRCGPQSAPAARLWQSSRCTGSPAGAGSARASAHLPPPPPSVRAACRRSAGRFTADCSSCSTARRPCTSEGSRTLAVAAALEPQPAPASQPPPPRRAAAAAGQPPAATICLRPQVFMPALSSTMTSGKIVSWLKSPGDKVKKGESIVVRLSSQQLVSACDASE